uniref:LooS14 n=1 Tax=Nocardiopsis flavescens TaxID=758803 RepID=A0A6M5K874_9ACTN|nr:LooS14 [Nocardiopsis flavescens]
MQWRLATSAATLSSRLTPDVHAWYRERVEHAALRVEQVPFSELDGWAFDPSTRDLIHETGRYFSVGGVRVRQSGTATWCQPILYQPDIAILGILAREFDGVLHFLLQAKAEPGNVNKVQLSPTVQATSSNYTRVHGGGIPLYTEYFTQPGRGRVLVDVLQSEQGSWFLHKSNRNVIVEPHEDVQVSGSHRWLTLGQIHALLLRPDLINMDTRTVLSCLPYPDQASAEDDDPDGAPESIASTLEWKRQARRRVAQRTERIPLREVGGWSQGVSTITHHEGRHFDVVGVRVSARGREVGAWSQPLLAPRGTGVVALVVRQVDGDLQALMRVDVRPGYREGAELGPTVQCHPDNRPSRAVDGRADYLPLVLGTEASVLYEQILSEEGGRFLAARNRYLVVEAKVDDPDPDRFRWIPLRELATLVQRGHTVNVEARTLLLCLRSLR